MTRKRSYTVRLDNGDEFTLTTSQPQDVAPESHDMPDKFSCLIFAPFERKIVDALISEKATAKELAARLGETGSDGQPSTRLRNAMKMLADRQVLVAIADGYAVSDLARQLIAFMDVSR